MVENGSADPQLWQLLGVFYVVNRGCIANCSSADIGKFWAKRRVVLRKRVLASFSQSLMIFSKPAHDDHLT
jgi:hypothetical protein